MNNWKRWWTMPALIAAGIVGPGLAAAPTAHADAADEYAAANYAVICEAIAEKPFVSTVVTVVEAIAIDTGSFEFAGSVVGISVRDYCPWNIDTVKRFVAVYAPPAQQVA
jgi:hypothetical protein